MTVTYARTGYSVNTTTFTAPTPPGTGGRLVVVDMHRGGNPTVPDTPADWTAVGVSNDWSHAGIRAWAATVASPDMGFSSSGGSQEHGLFTLRIDDADVADSVAFAPLSANTGTATVDMPDVSTAPDGAAIAIVGIHNDTAPYVSSSLGWTEQYVGDIGGAGWYAEDCAILSLDAVTPGGGTFDSGTVTFSGSALQNFVVLVVETSGGGGAPPVGQLDSLAGETDLAFVGRSDRVAQLDSLAGETDLAFVGRSDRVAQLDSLAGETDLAFVARSDRAGLLGLDARVALAFEASAPSGGQLDGLAGETDLAFVGRSDRVAQLDGLVGETDLAFVGRTDRAASSAVSAETGLAFVARSDRAGLLDLDVEVALSFVTSTPGGGGRFDSLAGETDLAFVGRSDRVAQLDSLAGETDLAFVARSDRAGLLGLDARVALAFVGRAPTVSGGFTLDARSDLALVGRANRRGLVGLDVETDLAFVGRTPRAGSLALDVEGGLAFLVRLLGTHPTAHSTSGAVTVNVLGAPDGTTVFAVWRGGSVRYVTHPEWGIWSGDPGTLVPVS